MKQKKTNSKYSKPAASKNKVYFYSKKVPDFELLLAVETE